MSKFKVVPTPDHGTRLVPVDPTPKTEEEWLAAACEHDITYGEESVHTPIPWMALAADRSAWNESKAKGMAGCVDAGGVVVAYLPHNMDNARLIAAAPELLELAQFIVLNIGGYDPEKARDMARAAIAKATGGAL